MLADVRQIMSSCGKMQYISTGFPFCQYAFKNARVHTNSFLCILHSAAAAKPLFFCVIRDDGKKPVLFSPVFCEISALRFQAKGVNYAQLYFTGGQLSGESADRRPCVFRCFV
jgi:hypothetical protein